MTALDLWYGNINPHETFLNGNCRFKHLLSLMGRNRDNLSETLTEQQKEILAKYDEAVNEMHSLAEETAFHCGVYLDTVKRGNTAYETDGLNNQWLMCYTKRLKNFARGEEGI